MTIKDRTPRTRNRAPSLRTRPSGSRGQALEAFLRRPSVRAAALPLFLCFPWALYAYHTLHATHEDSAVRSSRRNLSVYQSCSVTALIRPDRPVVPVYAASYPGSGAQMLHYLTEALTGLAAGDEFRKKDDWYELVSVKTHYPARPHRVEGPRLMKRAILLVRNPLHALPSHANYHYEKENRLPDHTARATPEYWIAWRDEYFEKEIDLWEKHLAYWCEEYPAERRIVVSYEHLTDSKRGPVETTRIGSFLGRAEGVNAVPQERVPCVWDRVVNYKGRTKRRAVEYVRNEKPDSPDNNSLRSGNDDVFDFTKDQLQRILDVLEELKEKFMKEYTLVMSLEEYIEDTKQRLKETSTKAVTSGNSSLGKGDRHLKKEEATTTTNLKSSELAVKEQLKKNLSQTEHREDAVRAGKSKERKVMPEGSVRRLKGIGKVKRRSD